MPSRTHGDTDACVASGSRRSPGRRECYFIAPKRLSNEFADTIGWAPATSRVLARQARRRRLAHPRPTASAAGGRRPVWVRLLRCWSAVFGAAASRTRRGSLRLASMTFGLARCRRRRAGGGVGSAAEADLAGEAGEEAVGLRARRRVGDPRRRGAGARRGRSSSTARRAVLPAVSAARGGLTWDGMVPGARDKRQQRQALAVAAFGQAGVAVGQLGGEHLVHAAVDAGVDSRHRRALARSAWRSRPASCCCFSRTASAISSGIT